MIYKILKSIQLFFKTAKIMFCLAFAWDINRIHHYEQMQDELDKEMKEVMRSRENKKLDFGLSIVILLPVFCWWLTIKYLILIIHNRYIELPILIISLPLYFFISYKIYFHFYKKNE